LSRVGRMLNIITLLSITFGNRPVKTSFIRPAAARLAVAALVRDHGAKALAYVSSIGASPSSRWFYLRAKGNTENQLQHLGLPSLTLVRPSGILGVRQPPRRAEELFLGLCQIARPLLPKRWRVVTGKQVAKALLEAVLNAPLGTIIIESEVIQGL
jgi:uncharacterized protein YbjT (DUF2867 family)